MTNDTEIQAIDNLLTKLNRDRRFYTTSEEAISVCIEILEKQKKTLMEPDEN